MLQVSLASISGKCSNRVSAKRLVGKNKYARNPAARAASKVSAPNKSATKPTTVRRVFNSSSAEVISGMSRIDSTDMRVSMAESGGRSERDTGGKEKGEMEEGSKERSACWVFDAVLAKVMSVAVKPCFVTRSLASSAKGMRWPMPGVARSTMWGLASVPPFSMGRCVRKLWDQRVRERERWGVCVSLFSFFSFGFSSFSLSGYRDTE